MGEGHRIASLTLTYCSLQSPEGFSDCGDADPLNQNIWGWACWCGVLVSVSLAGKWE
jgi:hypothetical protein